MQNKTETLCEPQSQIQPQAQPQVPVQVFQVLDQRDEDQILAEMRGEILEDLVYDVTMSGRRVTNLSYAGVKEAIRHRGNVEILTCTLKMSVKKSAHVLRYGICRTELTL